MTEILIKSIVIPVTVHVLVALIYAIVYRKDNDVYQKSYYPTLAEKEAKEKKVRRTLILYALSAFIGVGLTNISLPIVSDMYHDSSDNLNHTVLKLNFIPPSFFIGFMVAIPFSIVMNNIRKRLNGDYYKKKGIQLSHFFSILFLILTISFSFWVIRTGIYLGENEIIVKKYWEDEKTIPLAHIESCEFESDRVRLKFKDGSSISLSGVDLDRYSMLHLKEFLEGESM
ncbi:hypothetical protein [Flammeovirga aprica]|uniref:Uncharacterized protein n=1 Tax=Flammeovirga aprica JL-4 TaxID=694437 RepID=A0A7X9XCE8_9BACT|nr:hypothetical protein [Flammeovirga aprica]NME71741.1 hypothetical protein [Flammeovirga aprica JL-4]